jgi:hypothetical protein
MFLLSDNPINAPTLLSNTKWVVELSKSESDRKRVHPK